jgi:hypothetical protein
MTLYETLEAASMVREIKKMNDEANYGINDQ